MSPSVIAGNIVLADLSKRYGSLTAVSRLNLQIDAGEFMTLLGPSGSGKTTTLNLIAGFAEADTGDIFVDGRPMGNVPAHRRGFGVVFQNYALFPHMTVAQNIAFPLRQRGYSPADRDAAVRKALETVRLAEYGNRFPSQLSGGQQQRVALARAISFQPSILLMDEPLGALDRKLRETMQFELRRIHRELGCTVICVTHDQEEALALSDRIAVFNDGRIEQAGTGESLYEQPQSLFIARFLGESTTFSGDLRNTGDRCELTTPCGTLQVAQANWTRGSSVTLVLRPERLRLTRSNDRGSRADNRLPVEVQEVVYLGSARRIAIKFSDGTNGVVREVQSGISRFNFGDHAFVEWDVADGVLVPAENT